MVLKLCELTRFTLPNKSIYFNFVQCVGSVDYCDVDIFKLTPVRSPLIEKSMDLGINLQYHSTTKCYDGVFGICFFT